MTAAIDRYLSAMCDGCPEAMSAAVVSFTDPDTPEPLGGVELTTHLSAVDARFPGSVTVQRTGPVLAWTRTAAHRDAYLGMPGTGSPVVISGVDVLTERADGLHVHRHFDRLAVAEALGYAPRFVPAADGHREFGVGTRTPGRAGDAGALVLTWLDVRDDAESAEVDLLSVEIVKSLRAASGFLGATTLDIGTRKYTLSAFDRPESVRAVHARPHQRAMRRFFRGGLCTGAYTGVWSPVRETRWERCADCAAMTAVGATCECGTSPDAQPLF